MLKERLGDMNEFTIDAYYRIGLVLKEMTVSDVSQLEYQAHMDNALIIRNQFDLAKFENSISSPEKEHNERIGYQFQVFRSFVDSTMIYYDQAKKFASRGEVENAEGMFQRCIFVRERKFGKSSHELSPILFFYGEFLFNIGLELTDLTRVERSCEVIKRCISINSEYYGRSDESVQKFLSKLAQIYIWRSEKCQSMKDLEEARKVTVELLSIQNERMGSNAELTKETAAALDFIDRQMIHLSTLQNLQEPDATLIRNSSKAEISFKSVYLKEFALHRDYYHFVSLVIYISISILVTTYINLQLLQRLMQTRSSQSTSIWR